MRIARLELRAFGPFRDVALDFAGADGGLHIVYGPNEAGKSSALRALLNFLYGIPERTNDDFIHAYRDLRIGGVVTNGSAERLTCVRRKARSGDLRGPDDTAPVDPAVLDRYLGGIDRDTFATMFGIDHAALVAGGRDIVAGKGNLGQVLFAAGSGLANLKAIQEQLDKEAGELFKPTGKNQRINARLSDWEAARRATKAAQLTTAEWEREDGLLRESQAKLAETSAALEQARVEHERLKRIAQAVPLAARLRDACDRLAPLADTLLLADDFAERRREALAARSAADRTLRGTAEAVAELDAQIAALVVPDELIARGEAIEQLQNDLGVYRQARHDLPHRRADASRIDAEAERLLRQLRPDVPLAEVEKLRLTKKARLEIQNLGNRHEGLLTRLQTARSGVRTIEDRLRGSQERLAALEAPRDAEPLKSVLRRAGGVGRLQEELIATRDELARLDGRAAAALARFSLWSGSLEAVEKLPVPAAESIDAFESRFAQVAQLEHEVAKAVEQAEAEQAEYERQLKQARLAGDVPSEAELLESRRRRDEGWQLICRTWRDGTVQPAEEARFVAVLGHCDTLAEAFAEAVRQADELADRLRREADRIAAHAALLAAHEAGARSLEKLAERRRQASAARQAAESEWRALWEPVGVDPRSPREMRAWERGCRELAMQAEAVRKQRGEIATLQERLDRCRQELERALTALDEPAQLPDESLSAALERGHALARRIDAATGERARLTDEIAVHRRQLDAERLVAGEADRELASWLERWSHAVAFLGLPADATPEQANEVLGQIDDLFNALAERDAFQRRIEEIGRYSEAFERQVRDLVVALGRSEDLGRLAADQAADRLLAEYRRGVAAQGRLDTLRDQRQKHLEQSVKADEAAATAQAAIAALCQEAACDDEEALPRLEELSIQAKALRATAEQLQEQLLLLSAGAPLADLLEQVGHVDPDALPGKLAQLDERIAELNAAQIQLSETVGRQSKVLADMGVSEAAADAECQARHLAAEIAADAEEYVRLRLAAAVLREALERYRERHQGPVVERASRLFAELTAGSFAGLRADYADGGEAVLVGFRPGDGRAVPVEGMSEGTADQLYLALRLASLEIWLAEKGPMPFVVDDILIKFDNQRSIATLRVLAELGRQTQVVFFTHHEHLLGLARKHLPPASFVIHQLGEPQRPPGPHSKPKRQRENTPLLPL